jgi:hypothetical protein
MCERPFARAAGVNPPWVSKHVCADTSALVRQTADGVCADRRCTRVIIGTTGGLRPPLLCWCTDACERKNDFCDVRTPTRKSGGRQPVVARQTERCAAKIGYCSPTMRRMNTSDTRSSSEGAVPCRCDYPEPRLAYASRSWCTCVCSVRDVRLAMRRRASNQERRRSARRGSVIRRLRSEKRTSFSD